MKVFKIQTRRIYGRNHVPIRVIKEYNLFGITLLTKTLKEV